MPVKGQRKIYKCVKKVIGDKTYLCVQIKNLSTADIREVRNEVNALLTDFWRPKSDTEEEYKEDEKHVHFDPDER